MSVLDRTGSDIGAPEAEQLPQKDERVRAEVDDGGDGRRRVEVGIGGEEDAEVDGGDQSEQEVERESGGDQERARHAPGNT